MENVAEEPAFRRHLPRSRCAVGKNVNIPAGSAATMVDAVSVLRDVTDIPTPRKAIAGTARVRLRRRQYRCRRCRTARRLGASESVILYRRTRDQMPAHDSEVKEARKRAD
ncbi:MAG: hypothetical protein U1U88_000186 [Lawsonella clevelandensis]